MASIRDLRPDQRLATAWRGSIRGRRQPSLVTAFVLAAAAVAAGVLFAQLAGSRSSTATQTPAFLTEALGAPQPDAPRVRRPAHDLRIRLERSGYSVERSSGRVTLASDLAGGGWTAHSGGAVRRTTFGEETVTVSSSRTEQFLTVRERQGRRTWTWALTTGELRPRIGRDGTVALLTSGDRPSGFSIRPAAILDAAGRDVTPGGLRWRLAKTQGDWTLRLTVDDRELPLPYVIDPAVDHPSPLYVSAIASSALTSPAAWRLTTTTGTVNSTTSTTPAKNAQGYYLWLPGTGNTNSGTPGGPTGTGWMVDALGGTGFPGGNWSFTVKTDIPATTLVAGSANLAVGVWKVVLSGGAITSSTEVMAVTDDPLAQDLRTSINPVTTTVTYALPKFELAANERIYVEFWRNQTAKITTNLDAERQLDFQVNDGVARIVHPLPDDAGPTHSLSVTAATGAYLNAGTLYYKGDVAGSFRFRDALTDSAGTGTVASGVLDLDYPDIATTGWTHGTETVTAGPNYESSVYSWTPSPSNPTGHSLTAEDNALQTSSAAVTFASDTTPPAVTPPSVTVGYYTTPSIPVTRNGGTDTGGSGANAATSAVERQEGPLDADTCDFGSATWSSVTLAGGNDTTVTSGNCYRYRETLSDNVGNAGASGASNMAKVDTTAPAAPSLAFGTFTNAVESGGTIWYRPGAATASFTVTATATDAQSGIAFYSFPAAAGAWTVSGSGNSRTYSHSGSPSNPGDPNQASATNNAGLTSPNASYTVEPDSTAPSVTAPSVTAGYFTSLSVPVSLNGGSDSESGVDAASSVLERDEAPLVDGTCDPFPSTWGTTVTLSAGNDTTVASGTCYRYRELLSDNVGNQGGSGASPTARIDTAAPGSTLTFPTASGSYLTAEWDSGCASPGLCGSASDTGGSGVATVEISIRQGAGNYWDGAGFDSAGEVWLAASGTAAWSYAFGAGSFPADGSYTVRVRATDGAGIVETPSSATFTYASNSPPTATVSLSPASPTTNDTLTATATKSDPDGDPVTLTYVWKVDGVTVKTTAGSASLTDTLDLSVAGNGDKGEIVSVEVTPNDGNANGSMISDSETVVNSAPTATVSLAPASPQTDDMLTASAGTGDIDGDAVTVGYVWKRNGVVIAGETGATLDLSVAGNGDKGDTITVEATPNDGDTDGTAASDSETVANTAPTATASLSPAGPKTNDILTATPSTSDADGDTVTVGYVWKKNGVVVAGETGSTLDLSVHGDEGDVISIEVTPNDGSVDGAMVSDSETVANSSPTATVSLAPASPKTDDTLTATIVTADPDGDTVTVTRVWKKNGIVIPGQTGTTLDLSVAGNGDKGDLISIEVTPNDGDTDGAMVSDSETVANTAPTATVSLSPANPKTDDTLTATITTADADGDTVTVTRVWKKNGIVIAGQTGATLDLSVHGDKGDVISLEVTPNDGDGDGAMVSDSETVANTAPTATVSLSPANPKTDDTLTATPSTGDADGDTVTVSYVWKKNGLVVAGQTGASLDLSVAGNGDKGDTITVEATPNDGDTDGASAGDAETVANSAPVLTSVTIDQAAPTTNDVLTATIVASDPDGDALTIDRQWAKNGVDIFAETAASLDLSVFGNGDKGDSLTLRVSVTDGTDTDGPVTSGAVVVQNSAPVLNSVTIDQAAPTTDDVLSATVAASDDDGDTITVSRQWRKSGGDLGGETAATLDLGIAGNGDKGDSIALRVSVSDGADSDGPLTSSAVVVQNTAPTASVSLSPANPSTDDTVMASTTTSDDDGDTVSVSYVWKRDGVVIAGETGPTLDLSVTGNGDNGDVITVEVTPNDGDEDGSTASDAVTIQNALPTATVSLAPANPKTDDSLTASVTTNDADGDTVTVSYVWKKNGVVLAGETGSTLDLSVAGNGDKGDTITVEATPNDGNADGPAAGDSALVANTAPAATVALAPASPKTDDTLTATPSTSDADGDTVTVSYVWKKNGVVIAGQTGSTLDLSLAGNGDKGDLITVEATPNDGSTDGATAADSETVADSAPTATVSLEPANPKTNDTLTATVTTNDADGDPVTVSYVWKNEGVVVAGETGSTLDLAAHGDKGDTITVEVTPIGGVAATDSATVANSAPTATVTLAPVSPKTDDVLTASASTADDDGDAVSVSYIWKKNGAVIAGETGSALDLSAAGNGDKSDVITVEATPNDGEADGAAATDDVTVADSAPTATVSLAPASPKTNDTLTATVTTDDVDGDPVTVSYVWKNEGAAIAGETGSTLDLSAAGNGDKGDTVTVEVTPAGGTPVSDAVTVANSAPVLGSVAIDQAAPQTNDILTATITITDDDGDTLSATRQWRKNGADLGGATGATLDLAAAGNGDKGDAISLRVSLSDGTDSDGPLTSSPVTVANSAPVCSDTSLMTFQDQAADTAPVCTDADAADSLTFAIVSQGTIGTASVAAGQLQYEPDPGITGTDSFTYEANDGTADSPSATVDVTVDPPSPVAPYLPALVSPAPAAFTSAAPTLAATFSDLNSGDTGTIDFEVCADAACTSVVSSFSSASGIANGANGSAAVPSALDDATAYFWRARATDDTARTSGWSATRALTVDVSGPNPSVSFPVAGADYRAATWTTPEGAAVDGGSGVQTVEVAVKRLSDGFWWDATISSWVSSMIELFDGAAGTGSWSYAFPVAEFDTDGLYELSVRATDALGNETTTVAGFRIDRDAPTTGDNAPAAYRNGPVTVTLAPADTGSGVQTTTYEVDGGATQTGTSVFVPGVEGTYTITYRSTDAAGNVETDRTATVRIDTTAPTTTDDAPAGYRNTPVNVTLSPADTGGSGVQTTTYELDGGATQTGTGVSIPGVEGTYTITYRTTDAAGNVETDRTATVRIDTTVPTTSDDAPAGWQGGAVTVTLSAADSGGAGVLTTTYELDGGATQTGTSVAVPAVSGSYAITYRSTDAAGNAEGDRTATVQVDVTSPSISLTYPSGGALVSGVVTITTTPPSDGHSGVSGVAYAYSAAGEDDWQSTSSAWDTSALDDGSYDVRAVVTDNAGNTAESAVAGVQVDNNPPDLTFTAPAAGAYVNSASPDPLTLSADATDAGTGVQEVEFFECTTTGAGCAGGSWSSVDVDATGSPYTAAWTLPDDGNRALRAVASDNVGHVAEQVVEVTVDRTAPAATMDDPGDHLRGTIGLSASASDATSGVGTVTFQHSPAGAGSWQAISTDTSAPYTATFATTSLADGLYDFRVFVTDVAGNVSTAAVASRRVDNTKPTAAIDDPGDYLRATVTLTSSAADAGSGVATVEFQRSPAGAGSWTTVGTDADGGDGWSTDLVTTGLADGLYDFRVVVTDRAGNGETSSIGDRRVDNTKPTAAIDDPGQFLRDAVALSGSSGDAGSGVATVEFQRSPAGAGAWTQLGVDADGADGWSGSFTTTSVADGLYDLRVVATDRAGNVETAVVAARRVDNTKPTAGIDDPGAFLRSTVTLTGSASDAGSGVTSVGFERSEAGSGGPWTPIGSDLDGAGGWSADFDSTGVADGLYDLRVLVTDRAGNTETAVVATRRVDNTAPSTGHDAPGGPSSVPVTVTLTPSDSGSGAASTQYRVDSGPWQSGTSVLIPAPADHSNDGSHAIEFYSADAAGNVEGVQSAGVVIDTTGATGTPADPGSFLRGVVTLESAADDDSGIVSAEFELSPAGMEAWASIGTDFAAPFSVTWDTTLVADGAYDLRVRIEDGAGNESLVDLPGLPKYVDNTPATGSVTAPAEGAFVSGSVGVSAAASDTPLASGISSVTFEVKPAGAGGFSSLGGDTTAPYSVAWDTTGMPDGPAELRVVVADLAGNAPFTSAVRTVTVDNDAPTITFTHPKNVISGTTTLNASGSADVVSMTFQRSPAGAGTWTAIGTDTDSPFQASFDTTLVADGLYDIRVVGTDGSGNTGTSQVLQMRVDNTAPSGAMTQPTAGATVGGPSIPLAASSSDAGSGIDSVSFQFRPLGGGAFIDLAGSSWDASAEASGQYELRAIVRDNAGNEFTTAAITVIVDSTAPTVSLADPGASLQDVASLSASVSGGGAVRVVFAIAPAGSGSWSELAEDTTSPYAASFDTTQFADGLYDLNAFVYDQYDNYRGDVRAGIRIDNTPPSLASSSPADGTVVSSVPTISVTSSETLSAVTGLTLDGSPVAPTLAGDSFSVDAAGLGAGPHVLAGTLEDVAGRARPFRLHFTIPAAGDVPYVEKNAPWSSATTLTAVDGSATVTMPAGAWQAQPDGDWLVLRVDPVPAGSIPGSTALLSGAVVDVTAHWALAGTEQHQFAAPLDILIADTSGSVVVPATLEGSSWRMLRPVASAGALPSGWQDGFYRDSAGVHVVTRHLSLFALLLDVEPPEAPGFGPEIAADGLTLRWYPGRDNSGFVQKIALLVNGAQYQLFDPTQFEVKLGPITADDTRTFAFAQQDAAGNWSAPTPAMRALPPLAGKSLDEAEAALAERGFSVGHVREQSSSEPSGTVLEPSAVAVLTVGSAIDLVVSAGPTPIGESRLVFSVVGTKMFSWKSGKTIAVRVSTTRAAGVTVVLMSPQGKRVHTWRFQVKAGRTIKRLPMPRQVKRAGKYRLVVTAISGSQSVRRTIPVEVVAAVPTSKKGARKAKPVEIVLAARPGMRNGIAAGLHAPASRLIQADGDDEAFMATGSPKRNVEIVVVDVDRLGLRLVRDLRIVFPTIKLVALSADPGMRVKAVRAGAAVALLRSTPPAKIARVIRQLSQSRPQKR